LLSTVGLWRAILQRIRADWPVVLAAALLLASATTLLATGTLYGDTVALGGLRRAIIAAPPPDRLILVTTTGTSRDVESLDGVIAPEVARAIATTGGDVQRIARSGPFVPSGSAAGTLTTLGSYGGIRAHAALVEGDWPAAGRDPFEAALSEGAARALELTVGERIAVVNRLDESMVVDLSVSGIFRPDPADPYWAGDGLELTGVAKSQQFTTNGPFVLAEEDLLGGGIPVRFELQWRGIPAIAALGTDDLDLLRTDIELLDDRIGSVLPGDRQFRVTAALPAILADVDRSVLVSRSGVLLLTIQFAVVAGYAVVLVGGLLLERRRTEAALLRSRGASSGHLVAMAVSEALLLAVPAVLAAPLLAVAIVSLLGETGPLAGAGVMRNVEVSPAVVAVAAGAGLACVVALALPVLTSGISLAGVRAAIGRQAGATLPQRLGIDLALLVLAGIALWQLRTYGAPLTRNARGLLGVDPLLVAAPSIGLLAGAVIALRIVPRIAELAERVLQRRRGLVAALGGRQLARRPLRYTRAALLLMLAAGLGTFASAHAATWTQSQADQAAYQAVSDVRVVTSEYADLPPWGIGSAYRAIPGVAAATPVERHGIDAGPQVRGGPLLAVDAETARGLITFPAGGATDATRTLLVSLSGQPAGAPVSLEGEPQRLSLVIDAALTFEFAPENEPVPERAIQGRVVVLDADGRVHRLSGATTALAVGRDRIEVPLGSTVDGIAVRPAYPLSLIGIELDVLPGRWAVGGRIDLLAVESSASEAGGGWSPVGLEPGAPGWSWLRTGSQQPAPSRPPAGSPWRVDLTDPSSGLVFQATTFRLFTAPDEPVAVPAIVGPRFLELTGARVGETIGVSVRGARMDMRIAGVVAEFPPIDPEQPFAIVDTAALDLARFTTLGQVAPAKEWWLQVDQGREADVVAALGAGNYGADAITGRAALTQALSTEPVSLGVIGVLGLGAVAALVFAGIGFVVSATVSTAERVGEFALLRALGLSTRQLSVWLSVESAFLLVVGLLAGSALGLLLAWLVLPFATLTDTGAVPVPTPIVVVPWQAIAPTWVMAVVLLAVTVLVVRRQLPAMRISGVLRGRDE
jgi:FtsX-like permease family